MPIRALQHNLDYSVKGRVHRTEEGQVFDESPWDQFTTNKYLAKGYIEEVLALETSEPAVEIVEAEEELDLESMKKSQLVELAESRGLDSSGTKATLLARLSSEEEE
jgi:hypothetical protein